MSLFTKLYDPVMEPIENRYLAEIRKKLLQSAEGKVLEIGIGTGANFPFYPKGIELHGVEPSKEMIEKAYSKMRTQKIPIQLLQGNAESLPYPNDFFDTVISTLVLCSVKDLDASLKELHRVLKANGKLLLIEHVRLDNPHWLGVMQDALTPAWSYFCDGCQLNRETIQEAEKYFSFINKKSNFKNLFITAIGNKKRLKGENNDVSL